MERHVSSSEKFITTSVIGFINEHIHSAHLRYYVTWILLPWIHLVFSDRTECGFIL